MNNSYHLKLEDLGTKIKDMREAKKMSQEALSEKLNLSETSISKLENGKTIPTLDTLLSLAKVFNTSPDHLLGFVSDTSLADIAKALLVLYFYEGAKMRRFNIWDDETNESKIGIEIRITKGKLRRFMSDFLALTHDRSISKDRLFSFYQTLNNLSEKTAFDSKDEDTWNRFVRKLSWSYDEDTAIAAKELNKFIYGGIDDGESQTENK